VAFGWMRWYRVSDDGGEFCGVMMGRDMGGGKVVT